ncbi:hypothetical protein HDV00_012459 [Rhizophlyctis rosea]|nr:hypothetical protein HDV00_012459 [Rhizophlyctis rosea]
MKALQRPIRNVRLFLLIAVVCLILWTTYRHRQQSPPAGYLSTLHALKFKTSNLKPSPKSAPHAASKNPFGLIAGDWSPAPANRTCKYYSYGTCPNTVPRMRFQPADSTSSASLEPTILHAWKDIFEAVAGRNLTIIGDSTTGHIFDDARCYVYLNGFKCTETKQYVYLNAKLEIEMDDYAKRPVQRIDQKTEVVYPVIWTLSCPAQNIVVNHLKANKYHDEVRVYEPKDIQWGQGLFNRRILDWTLDMSEIVVLNLGVHYDRGNQYQNLTTHLTDILSATSRRNLPTILRSHLPQHFESLDNSGSFREISLADRRKRKCVPSVPHSPTSDRINNILKLAAAKARIQFWDIWEYYSPRGDLHVREGDCTHYCWTEWTWEPAMMGLARGLKAWKEIKR